MENFEVTNTEMVENTQVENVQVEEAPVEDVQINDETATDHKGYGLLVKGLLLAGGMYAAYRAGKKAKDKDPSEKKPGLIQRIKDKFSKKAPEAPAPVAAEATTVKDVSETTESKSETN